jgi:carbon monoxide dehydrogenase subunit G
MPVVTGSVDIQAPREKVFDYIAAPEKATAFIPGLSRISHVGPAKPEVGRTWEFEFDWFGIVVSGKSRCVSSERPAAYVFETTSGAKSTWSYRFDEHGKGTKVTLSVDFEEPAGLLARFAAQGALKKMNEDRGRETLTNLKALLE